MPSRSSRSPGRSRRSGRPRPGVDVYLLPAVVGGGLGDIEEVLAAGRRLSAAGFPVYLFRLPGRPLPKDVEGPWQWPRVRRRPQLPASRRAALTVSPAWGVSAAPGRAGALGRPGPWAEEATAIERAYGPERTLHVSLEEFARTLTVAEEDRERLREGGVPRRALGSALGRSRDRGERAVLARAYREFRAFDRPNVLPLFATFAPSRAFAGAFPEAVQCGPLWPGPAGARSSTHRRRGEWVWYASPSSAERIAPQVLDGLGSAPSPRPYLYIRTPRPWRTRPSPALGRIDLRRAPAARWAQRFRAADLRIVTGSRTLLEALELAGPFLYFNGVVGGAGALRRHRPEKLRSLLAAGRRSGWPADLLRDLADFASGRRVAAVVARAARRSGGWGHPRPPLRVGFRPPLDDAGSLLVTVADRLARPGSAAPSVVAEIRRLANP